MDDRARPDDLDPGRPEGAPAFDPPEPLPPDPLRPSPLPGAPLPGTPTAYDPYAWGRSQRPRRASPPWMQHPEGRAPRWGIGDVLLGIGAWFLTSILFALPGVIVALQDATDASGAVDTENVQIGGLWSVVALVGSWTGLLAVLFFSSRRRGFGTFARDFGFRFRWIDPVIGFGAGFATLLVTGIITQVISQISGEDPAGNAEAIFSGQEANTVGLVAMAIAGAIGAPIVEELFFRGLALRAIERRFGAVAGVIGSSVLFTLPHFVGGSLVSVLDLFAVIGVYAVVLSMLTRFMRRLGPAVFAHMTINGIGVALLVYTELFP